MDLVQQVQSMCRARGFDIPQEWAAQAIAIAEALCEKHGSGTPCISDLHARKEAAAILGSADMGKARGEMLAALGKSASSAA